MAHSLSPRRQYPYNDILHLDHSWGSRKFLVYNSHAKLNTHLEVEIQRLANLSSQLNEENRRLLRENENLLHEISNLKETRVLKGAETAVIASLTEENLKLSGSLSLKAREIDELKAKFGREHEEWKGRYIREIDEWKARYNRLEKSTMSTLSAVEKQYTSPVSQTVTVQNCDLCLAEITKLNTSLLEKDITIKDLMMKLELKQEPRMTLLKHDDSHLKTKIDILTKDNMELNRFLSEREGEIRLLRMRIEEVDILKATLRDMEMKTMEVQPILETKTNEVVVVKKIRDLRTERKLAEKSEKVDKLKKKVKEELKPSLKEKTALLTEIETKLALVTQEKEMKTLQLIEKTKILTERTKDLEALKLRLKIVEEENEKNLKEKSHLSNEKHKLEKDISKKKKKKKALKGKVKEYEGIERKLNMVSMEKDRLAHMLHDNESHVKSYKSQIEALQYEIEKIGELKLRISVLNEETENWKAKAKEKEEKFAVLSAQVSGTQEKINLTIKEKDNAVHEKNQINIILTEKNREVDLLKFQIEKTRDMRIARYEAEKEALRVIFEKEKEGLLITIKMQEEHMGSLKQKQVTMAKSKSTASTIKKVPIETEFAKTTKVHDEKHLSVIADLKHKLNLSTAENEKLLRIINSGNKQSDLEYVRKKLDHMSTESHMRRGDYSARNLTQSANIYYLDDLSGIRTKYSGLTDDSDILKTEIMQLRSELQTLKSHVSQVPLSESVVRSSYESRGFAKPAPLEKLNNDHSFGLVSEVRTAASSQFSPFSPVSSLSHHLTKSQHIREGKY